MQKDPSPHNWKQVSAELAAHREEQRRLWGEVDPATLGCYLANDVSSDERAEVEHALEEHPELRRLTDLVREVLGDCEPIEETSTPARDRVPAQEGTVLSFSQPTKRRPYARIQRLGALVAAACLLFVLGIGLFRTLGPRSPESQDPQLAETNPSRDVAMRTRLGPAGPGGNLPAEGEHRLASLDRRIEELDRQGKEADALALTLRYPQVAAEVKAENHPRYAQSLAKVGNLYVKQGYFAQAEPTYRKAWDICQDKLGPDAPATLEQLKNLAQVYQVALNTPGKKTSTFKLTPQAEAVGAGQTRSFPYSTAKQAPVTLSTKPHLNLVDPAKRDDGRRDKRLSTLRQQLVRQRPHDLRKTVVPVLQEAVAKAKNTRERVAYVQALSKLGPAAKDSVSVMIDRLEQTSSKVERRAVLTALGQVGPSAPEVIPTFRALLTSESREERQLAVRGLLKCGPRGRKALQETLKQNGESVRQYVRKENERPEHRMGILDSAQLFSPVTLEEAEQSLIALSSNANLEVYIETVSDLAKDEIADVEERAKLLGLEKHGVYLLVEDATKSVSLYVSPALRERGFDKVSQQRFLERVRSLTTKGEFDKALAVTLQHLGSLAER